MRDRENHPWLSKVAGYRPTTLVQVNSNACVFLGIHKVLRAPFSRSTFGQLLLGILLSGICKWSLIDESKLITLWRHAALQLTLLFFALRVS